LLAAVVLELASGVKTTRLSFTHDCCTSRKLANMFNIRAALAGFRRGGFVLQGGRKDFVDASNNVFWE
jgi:hypothetical protein